jgi:hypothetical protein
VRHYGKPQTSYHLKSEENDEGLTVRLRLVKVDEYQFLTCLKHSLWGSRSARFKDWHEGDYLAFIVDKSLAALAQVVAAPFQSKEVIWDNDLFPYRIPLKFVHVTTKNQRTPLLGQVRDALIAAWGHRYGWGILNQQLLTNSSADIIVKAILSRSNNLVEFESNMEQLLQDAKRERETISLGKKPRQKLPLVKEIQPPLEVFGTEEEESLHSQAQSVLIKLGKIAGCSVWIAPNDRNRAFRGKALGEECLRQLPNLGLSDEASRRISLIDIIWIKQNAPVCAFEVETTTSVYSGLLRMSDLLSVVPALNVKLYVVAPKERQDRVKAELTRPTFQKIGLNDYCKFIPVEELNDLLRKVEGLGGHVHPTIVETKAIGFGEEI